MVTVNVELGERSYPIYIGSDLLSTLGELCASHSVPTHVCVITDTNVGGLYLRQVNSILRHNGADPSSIVISPGERQKSLTRAKAIYETLLGRQFNRSSALVALGGGVVGDLTGYVAATFRRGIPYVQVPTTLLAQVESSIGGKVGVNLASRKNAVGAFYQPKFVVSDLKVLSSLPRREIVCGLGELLKYAYLHEELFTMIFHQLDRILTTDVDVIEEVLIQCNSIKAKMISEDERELSPGGGRMVLNLGHTVGHALEVLSNYRLHHGEAVLIGLRWELLIAQEARLIGLSDFEKLDTLLSRVTYGPNVDFIPKQKLLSAIFGQHPTAKFVIPFGLGKIDAASIDKSVVESVLKKIKAAR